MFPRVVGRRGWRGAFHFPQKMRRGKKEGVESGSSSALLSFKCLWPISRDVFYRASTEKGWERILQSRDSTEWSWRVASANGKAFFRFLLLTLPFHSAHSSSASKETRPFSIALRPSLSQLSDIIIPSINFASAPVPDIAGDARELDILPFSSRSRQTNRSIERKCDSSAAKTSITLSRWTCPDRAREDRFRKRIYLPFGTISHGIYFSKGECFWKKLCAGHFCREERFSSRAGFLLLKLARMKRLLQLA